MLWRDTGSDFEEPEVGTVVARCYRIIDMGTEYSEQYKDAAGKPKERRRTMITWELVEKMSDGRPFSISQWYTATLGEKSNLRHDLETWRGKSFTEAELAGFDPRKILGAPCMLSLTKDKKDRTRVASVIKLPKGMVAPDLVNPTLFFSLDQFEEAAFNQLSDNMKQRISLTPEYARAMKVIAMRKAEPSDFADLGEPVDGIPGLEEESIPF